MADRKLTTYRVRGPEEIAPPWSERRFQSIHSCSVLRRRLEPRVARSGNPCMARDSIRSLLATASYRSMRRPRADYWSPQLGVASDDNCKLRESSAFLAVTSLL